MLTDRQSIEVLLLPHMLTVAVEQGLDDLQDTPEYQHLMRQLIDAQTSTLNLFMATKRAALLRRMLRVYTKATEDYTKEGMSVDKFALATFWLIKAVTDCERLILHKGPLHDALETIMAILEPRAQIDKLNKSAQKAAAKMLSKLQCEGFYHGVTINTGECEHGGADQRASA
jgi:hypothetical protein